jgi:hypothetical protein
MWIIAIGWIYVVALMAATETTVVAGIMTFFGYCVLPLSILFYLTGSKRMRTRRELAGERAVPRPATTDDVIPGYDPTGLLFASASSDNDSSNSDCSNSDSSNSDASPDCGSSDAGSTDSSSDD